MAGIYFHIPFCKQACHYCDFHFSTNLAFKTDVVKAIVEEIHLQGDYLKGDIIETIYFGGGTPSILSVNELDAIFQAVGSHFSVSKDAEITVEANPDDLTYEKLLHLKEFGVNRLSIGIQSLDDTTLKFLNRAHSKKTALECISDSRKAGFSNVSVDLIYAIPNQDNKQWIKNIYDIVMLSPEHVSSYSLTIEEGTAFGRWSVQGKLKNVSDEVAAEQLEILMDEMTKAGYDQYEVSNFGKPSFYSLHNSNYWKQKPYLGIGPSAHSYNGSSRQYNISNNHLYLKSIKERKIPFTREELSREDLINEYLLTSLRTKWGCNFAKLLTDYSYDLGIAEQEYINELLRNNLATINDGNLILTNKGKLLADKIASDLFLLP